MKKKSIFLSVLVAGLFVASFRTSQASALYIDNKDHAWYSVSELLEYKKEYDREAEEVCGVDSICLEELFFSKMDSTELKFQAFNQLMQQQFVVTSINPSEETIKVLFFDEDAMMRYMGIHESLRLGELYIGWFDYGSDRIFNYSIYTDELFDEALPGAHLIYAQRDNRGNKIPANQEFELYVPGSNLLANRLGVISYAAFADPYFNAMGYFDYASCLMEPDYVEGTECRLMFSAEEGQRYFPPRETVADNDESSSLETNENNENEDNRDITVEEAEVNSDIEANDSNMTIKDEMANDVAVNNSESASDVAKNAEFLTNNVAIKAPNTGAGPCVQKTIEFPWWLMVLIAIGEAVILWLFWPKSLKKSKKVLDKKLRVR